MRILAACIIALLSGMGVGSGGLLVIYLTLVENLPQLAAQGTNLLFFLFAAAASLTVHISRRRIAGWAIVIMSAGGVLGSLLGSSLAAYLPEAWLSKLFGIMLVVSGMTALRGQSRGKKEPGTTSPPRKM